MKLKRVVGSDDKWYGVRFDCPGCDAPHVLAIIEADSASIEPTQHRWSFDGNWDAPTLGPSILRRTGHHASTAQLRPDGKCDWCEQAKIDGDPSNCGVCHSFVRGGCIEFLSDCTHALAGRTVPLPDIEPT